MNDFDRLIELGFDPQDVGYLKRTPEVPSLILQYHASLRKLGYENKHIFDLTKNGTSEKLLQTLVQYTEALKQHWNMSIENIVNQSSRFHNENLAQSLCDNHVQLKANHYTAKEILDLSKYGHILIVLVCHYQKQLTELGITEKSDLLVLSIHMEDSAPKFIADATIIIKKLGISLANWVHILETGYNGHLKIKPIIACHEKLIKLQLFTTDELIKFISAPNTHVTKTIEAVFQHYEKLLELKFQPADLVLMIRKHAGPQFILALVKHAKSVMEFNFSSKDLCVIWENKDSENGIESLCDHKETLKQLGIIEPVHLVKLTENVWLNLAIPALKKKQSKLASIGITSAADFCSIASHYSTPQSLDALFKNLAPLKKLGFSTPNDFVQLISRIRAAKLIEVILTHHEKLNIIGITIQRLKQFCLTEEFVHKNLEAVAEHGQVLKQQLQFDAEDFLKLTLGTRNIPEMVSILVRDCKQISNVPKNEILRIAVMDLTPNERGRRLTAAAARFPAERVVQPQPQPQRVAGISNAMKIGELEAIIQTQAIVLAELTKTHTALISKNAELKNQFNHKRPLDVSLEENGADLLESLHQSKQPKRSFFAKS